MLHILHLQYGLLGLKEGDWHKTHVHMALARMANDWTKGPVLQPCKRKCVSVWRVFLCPLPRATAFPPGY